jgi:ferrous iron transport protein A
MVFPVIDTLSQTSSQPMSPAEPADQLIPLSMLAAGDTAVVQSVVGSAELVRHLAEIGLRAGALLEMVRTGSTCILRLDGAKLCVRGDELLQVLVAPLSARHSA